MKCFETKLFCCGIKSHHYLLDSWKRRKPLSTSLIPKPTCVCLSCSFYHSDHTHSFLLNTIFPAASRRIISWYLTNGFETLPLSFRPHIMLLKLLWVILRLSSDSTWKSQEHVPVNFSCLPEGWYWAHCMSYWHTNLTDVPTDIIGSR